MVTCVVNTRTEFPFLALALNQRKYSNLLSLSQIYFILFILSKGAKALKKIKQKVQYIFKVMNACTHGRRREDRGTKKMICALLLLPLCIMY